nr:uncharacterized protein LOC129048858 [Pongo abelii]
MSLISFHLLLKSKRISLSYPVKKASWQCSRRGSQPRLRGKPGVWGEPTDLDAGPRLLSGRLRCACRSRVPPTFKYESPEASDWPLAHRPTAGPSARPTSGPTAAAGAGVHVMGRGPAGGSSRSAAPPPQDLPQGPPPRAPAPSRAPKKPAGTRPPGFLFPGDRPGQPRPFEPASSPPPGPRVPAPAPPLSADRAPFREPRPARRTSSSAQLRLRRGPSRYPALRLPVSWASPALQRRSLVTGNESEKKETVSRIAKRESIENPH